MYKTKILEDTQRLVAYDTVKSAFDSFAKRADRDLKPLAVEVYEALSGKKKFPTGEVVTAYRKIETKDKARTMTEGVEEFKRRHPKYGAVLQNIIDETRESKKRYLVFGVAAGKELPEETYAMILRNIGVPESGIESTLETVLGLSEELAEKRESSLREMLIK